MNATLRFFVLISIAALLACGGSDPGADAGTDGSTTGSCEGASDGTACGSGLHCLGGACVVKECGDGFVDEAAGEECDDGNDVAFDGCEPSTCQFTCESAAECDDGNVCTGTDTCTDAHVCEASAPPGNGTACTQASGDAGVCRGFECVSAGCGNGVVDAGEECDDGNDADEDGCQNDCTFTCEEDIDCADGSVCNGEETCDTATHVCVPGTPLDCNDGDECTEDLCDPLDGCFNPLIDADGDGHAPDSLACGTDCDDSEPAAFQGAEELCDGIDNDCNGIVDDGAPTWYVDCDGDGYAVDTSGATPVPSCNPPSTPPAGCTGGAAGWTSRRPVDASSTDCNDANANVFPGQTRYFTTPIPGAPSATRFDYDCSGGHTRQYGCVPKGRTCSTTCDGGYANRSDTNPNGCDFVCIVGRGCIVLDLPDCGESAVYTACGMPPGASGCISTQRTLAQGCR